MKSLFRQPTRSVLPKTLAADWTAVPHEEVLSRPLSRNKGLLVGTSVFVSTRDITAQGYAKLRPRVGLRPVAALFAKHPPKMFVAVKEAAMFEAPKGARFALAVDGYLAWGMKAKGKVILIGGWEDEYETHLDILVFDNGSFVDYESKTLPARSTAHFHDTLASQLDDYASKWPGYAIHHASPLSPFGEGFNNIHYVDESIFKRLPFRPLTFHAVPRFNGLVLPVLVVVAGLIIGAGGLGKGWSDYQGASDAFDKEVSDPIVKGQGGVDSGLIETIQQRRFFLDEPRRQVKLVEKSKSLVLGVGRIPNLKIVEIKMPAPAVGAATGMVGIPVADPAGGAGTDRQPDVWLRVSVPVQPGVSAWTQGKGLMTQLASNTGMDVRLARQGWADEGQRRIFILEGFING